MGRKITDVIDLIILEIPDDFEPGEALKKKLTHEKYVARFTAPEAMCDRWESLCDILNSVLGQNVDCEWKHKIQEILRGKNEPF